MAPNTPSQEGNFELGPIDGNCLEVWAAPDEVQNAHDLSPETQYTAPLNNNAQPLSPAPRADR